MKKRGYWLICLVGFSIVSLFCILYSVLSLNLSEVHTPKRSVRKMPQELQGEAVTKSQDTSKSALDTGEHINIATPENTIKEEELILTETLSELSSDLYMIDFPFVPSDNSAALIDPNPELTKKIMKKLKSNYENVQDIEYIAVEDFEEEHDREDAIRRMSLIFPNKMKIECDGAELDFRLIMDNNSVRYLTNMGGYRAEQILRRQDMIGRFELFDSINWFDYVMSSDVTNNDNDEEKTDAYILKSKRGLLFVDPKTFIPQKVVSYYHDGTIELEQKFIDFHEFSDIGFIFPKTIKVTYFHQEKPIKVKTTHIKDIEFNVGLSDDNFDLHSIEQF